MAQLKTVLFDLDGTLLPMDQDTFAQTYFTALAKKLAPRGYDSKALVEGIWAGTYAMMKNDGRDTNEHVFWQTFASQLGERILAEVPVLDQFYREDFDSVASCCGFTPKAKQTVDTLRAMGLRLGLATNPIFPAVATQSRIRWAGCTPDDFEIYTTYETSRYCKPRKEYYRSVIETMGVLAEECLMVGNDVKEDMAAETLGLRVFLLTDCVINKQGADISRYPQGSFDELMAYIKGELTKT